MFVIFDLDGTLALTEHREHYLKREPKDWRGFYAACPADEPCGPVVAIAHSMIAAGHDVHIWSGRSGEVNDETVHWLTRVGLDTVPRRLRPEGDHRPDTRLKAEWMEQEGRKPDLVFEDRASMVAMWRSHGIICCQVAPGEF